ncbi:MAG: prepilin-type N-terminal cleavage/methylation domain-containing protein [Caldiserica bacterium]|nr:prepilin-type N-terminal cleavage/methylation domain-containing protein [Caldisericota bacterium]
MKRKGFTLIELIVAMAILFILVYMSFAAFSFVNAMSRSSQEREAVVENITLVLDQVTKELRQTVTIDNGIGGAGNYGVQYPLSPSGSDSIRKLTTISMPDPPLTSGQYCSFGSDDTQPQPPDDPLNPILRFYIEGGDGVKHRISYTLGVTTDGSGNYKGIPRQYWVSQEYEPCEIRYSNQTWNGSDWVGINNQPVTDQVITNFTVIRPSWSNKVIQVVITRIVQIALRQ